ncbi:3-oxoacyl-ACP synthase III family protein [Okeania sp. KiyG1]|uniref:3-oxoacyl-ACP synthase III family protein n=1 Tax=Okeania sp. KiyG1 TaxID=2720165 RepID=UPI001921CF8F|nr:3-oxoacyl-[acyl-carrier-protein] synthase III C-terminal domain-containing protein [Okeania sp. KiyG1]GGA09376.1 3-oxoacyl-[acyl-carrier-protein] synthase 3 [Okeania sp. KiyG1]
MNQSVGIRALAVNFPEYVLTNDHWKKNYPDLLLKLEQKNQTLQLFDNESQQNDNWVQAVKPYREDIFRGTLERRVLTGDETTMTLECGAIEKVLQAAKLEINEVDLLISCAMFPERLVIGNATLIARELGFRGTAWNMNASCGGALLALDHAVYAIQSQKIDRILVSVSCDYSRHIEHTNPFSFTLGDGAAAFIVEKVQTGEGLLHSYSTNTHESCDVVYPKLSVDEKGEIKLLIAINKETVKYVTSLLIKYFQECSTKVLSQSGIKLEDIDFFVLYPPTAGYIDFCASELNIPKHKTIDIFPQYGNISVTSVMAALYHTAEQKKIKKGDLVMTYAHGFSGAAAAHLMRWGDVALGAVPPTSESLMKLTTTVGV